MQLQPLWIELGDFDFAAAQCATAHGDDFTALFCLHAFESCVHLHGLKCLKALPAPGLRDLSIGAFVLTCISLLSFFYFSLGPACTPPSVPSGRRLPEDAAWRVHSSGPVGGCAGAACVQCVERLVLWYVPTGVVVGCIALRCSCVLLAWSVLGWVALVGTRDARERADRARWSGAPLGVAQSAAPLGLVMSKSPRFWS